MLQVVFVKYVLYTYIALFTYFVLRDCRVYILSIQPENSMIPHIESSIMTELSVDIQLMDNIIT